MKKSFKDQLHTVIFEADTPLGKIFDVVLLILILLSILVVCLNSVYSLNIKYFDLFYIIEWVITIIFTIEYIARIYCVNKKSKYIFSFYGIIDLLSILPSYISLVVVGSHYLMIIRILRMLRVFRIFKLTRYVSAGNDIYLGLKNSFYKIVVFVGFVFALVVVLGSFMYVIEGAESGFDSIPRSIYWAIETITTVGYGDITPVTVMGQTFSSIIMLLGYSLIAVPTGIMAVSISKAIKTPENTQVCPNCNYANHDDDAKFCKRCGNKIE